MREIQIPRALLLFIHSLNLKHVLLDDIYIKQEEVLQAEREI